MEFSKTSEATFLGPPGTLRVAFWALACVSLVLLCVGIPMASPRTGVSAVAIWITLIWITISFVRGQFDHIALAWVAVYPYCYYLFSYPAERSIFTVDRAFSILIVIEMLIVSRRVAAKAPLTQDMRISGYLWALYLFVCSASLIGHSPADVLPSYRALLDGMLMPALFGLYAIRYFPLLKDLNKLHVSACTLGLGLCITALIEVITGVDLFPWKGSAPLFTANFRRADGPFEQQIVLSIVGLIVFFFILYLRRLMPQGISSWRAFLHRTGSFASLVAALLPLNRGLVLVLVPIAIIDWSSKYRLVSRRAWTAFFFVVLLAVIAARLLDPPLYEDRVSNPNNGYQRVAQQLETLRVVRQYPFFGVGFGLYYGVVSQDPRHIAKWKGIESMTLPHNVLMTVLSEGGIVSFLFYVSAQLFFLRAMWQIRKAHPPGWLAFLYCVLIYSLTGLDFATVYYSDINLLYIFVLGLLFQMQTRFAHERELILDRP